MEKGDEEVQKLLSQAKRVYTVCNELCLKNE